MRHVDTIPGSFKFKKLEKKIEESIIPPQETIPMLILCFFMLSFGLLVTLMVIIY